MQADRKLIELRASPSGLTAWCDGQWLGWADVNGTDITIKVSMQQVEAGIIEPDCDAPARGHIQAI